MYEDQMDAWEEKMISEGYDDLFTAEQAEQVRLRMESKLVGVQVKNRGSRLDSTTKAELVVKVDLHFIQIQ